jgi:hypothetical protein
MIFAVILIVLLLITLFRHVSEYASYDATFTQDMSPDMANQVYKVELDKITNTIPGVTGSERLSLMNDANKLQMAYNSFILAKNSLHK